MSPDDEREQLKRREMTRAGALIARTGVRRIRLADGSTAVGIWSDLDGPHIRRALALVGSGTAPVLYLDGPDVPMRYKVRRVDGDPVPLNILRAMLAAQAAGEKPWKVRDRMLLAQGPVVEIN
jgi:hypothetical protein